MTTKGATIDLTQIVARNVKLARTRLGLTQAELARKLGLPDGMAVSRWETARHRPNAANLAALADLTGEDFAWFYADHAAAAA